MANPVLILPNGTILRQREPERPVGGAGMIAPGMTLAWLPKEVDFSIPTSLAINSIVTLDPVEFRVPPPPMGRQIAVTFPPVYKEWGGKNATRPIDGPIWPRVEKPTR